MNFILSIAAGLLSSYLFLVFFLLNKKPKILISNQISRIRFNGEQNYLFKFVNLTNSEIFDVHIELTFYKPVGTFNGSNLQGRDIKLKDNFIAYVPRERDTDQFSLHAVRIRTIELLEETWLDESSFIRLTIIAKHALSGFNKVFVQDYLSKDRISSGKFLSGNSVELKV
ncbi:MAG: hypothetical protein RL045_1293 [Bacteroidota bacterium]